MNSVPEEIDTLDRRVRQLEIEREAIRREGQGACGQLTKEIEELKSRRRRDACQMAGASAIC